MTTVPPNLLPYPGSAILYKAAVPLERSMADADCERVLATDAEEIISVWDPYLISASNLPYLAWAMGVLLWEPGWQEATKREWTARQWEWKAIRGTAAGIEMAVNFVGRDHAQTAPQYDVVEFVTPPQGFFASADMTKEEWDQWIHLMPELRIKLTEGIGSVELIEFVAEAEGPGPQFGFSDDGFVPIDDGWILHGRRVILRQNGIDTPLQDVVRDTWVEESQTVAIERIRLPGKSTLGYFADEDADGEDKFVGFSEIEARLISVRLDGTYVHEQSTYGLSMLWPTLAPMDPRYERVSDIGDAGAAYFSDDSTGGWPEGPPSPDPTPETSFADTDQGGDMLADRIFLLDPAITGPMTEGMSFADVDRVGMDRFHAEALIDLHTREDGPAWISDEETPEEGFAIPFDGSHIDRACRAVVAAKALRDKMALSFETVRALQAQDVIDENTLAGEYRQAML